MDNLLSVIAQLLEQKKYMSVKEIVSVENAADLAGVFDELFGENFEKQREFLLLYRLLPKDLAAEVFAYMNPDMQKHLISAFTDDELREILDNSFIDDTVDIIEEMPANVVARILQNSSTGARKAINAILHYPKDSAGSIMTIEYVSLHKDMTVGESFAKIRRVGFNKETIYTCYVTENRKLLGIVTVKDLFLAEEDDRIGDIMETNIISVDTSEDKEVVANMFRKYDFLAIPVTDKDGRLVGIVTFDDAMDVIQEENTEDVTKMAAMSPNEDTYFRTGVMQHVKSRVGWLLILMVSATLTGMITTRYESAFEVLPILVSFMPMIMDLGGNCGSQSSTLIIRSLALDEIKFSDFFKVIFKEFRIAILVSSALAVVCGVYLYLTQGYNIMLSVAISLSIICTVIIAKVIGSSLPMLAKKVGLDPALMAAPLITTIVDSCSIFIYFNIASMIFGIK